MYVTNEEHIHTNDTKGKRLINIESMENWNAWHVEMTAAGVQL